MAAQISAVAVQLIAGPFLSNTWESGRARCLGSFDSLESAIAALHSRGEWQAARYGAALRLGRPDLPPLQNPSSSLSLAASPLAPLAWAILRLLRPNSCKRTAS